MMQSPVYVLSMIISHHSIVYNKYLVLRVKRQCYHILFSIRAFDMEIIYDNTNVYDTYNETKEDVFTFTNLVRSLNNVLYSLVIYIVILKTHFLF